MTALLDVQGLTKHFPITRLGRTVAKVRAVDGISFAVHRGRTLGLVGESGSGKSTTARLILRLVEPTAGTIHFDGVSLVDCRPKQIKPVRKRMQMVFQNPLGSLNPRMNVLDTVGEPLEVHGVARGREKVRRVTDLLEAVGLSGADLHKYAHQFSGGQAQRIGIARALATRPGLIVCDEAVSSLDVSVQAQILNLFRRLQRDFGLTYLFIAHDLNVVRYISDEICVMYLGKIMERGDSDKLFANPQHPYTKALLAAIPSPDPTEARRKNRALAPGDIPSPAHPPSGCRFRTRCPYAFERCTSEEPVLQETAPGQYAACHLHEGKGSP